MVSVIIPVYNAEDYIRRCIDSILNQSYVDFELLLVDDGSTDNSSNICDEYLYDSRVRVFHKENNGASSARNFGVKASIGEWIVFVDADDWCDSDYLKTLMSSGDVDFTTVFMSVELDSDSYERNIPYQKKIYYGMDGVEDFMTCCFRELAAPVCRRYKKEILVNNDMCFDVNLSIMEDLCFNLSYLSKVNSICVIPSVLYHYEKHSGSLTSRSIEWVKANYAISKIAQLISVFKNDIQLTQCYIWGNILRKYFISLQNQKSIYTISLGLKHCLTNCVVRGLFAESSIEKSLFRKSFDFFMLNDMCYLAAIMLKMEGLMLRYKLIKWK